MGDQEMQKNHGGGNFNSSENKQKTSIKITKCSTTENKDPNLTKQIDHKDSSSSSNDSKREKYCKILENLPFAGQQFAPPFNEFLHLKMESMAINDSHSTAANEKSPFDGKNEAKEKREINWQSENLARLRFRREIGHFSLFKGGQIPSIVNLKRVLHERLIRNAPKQATCVIDPEEGDGQTNDVQLCGISKNGRVLLGTFLAFFIPFQGTEEQMQTVSAIRECGVKSGGRNIPTHLREALDAQFHGSYRLYIKRLSDCILTGNILIDAAIAPMDSDVTCLLYATAEIEKVGSTRSAHPTKSSQKKCQIRFAPTRLNMTRMGAKKQKHPVYNQKCGINELVYSVSFCPATKRFCAGLENFGVMYNLLDSDSPPIFIPSNGRTVLASAFQRPAGNCLFLGLQGHNMSQVDLRLVRNCCTNANSIVGHFERSQDVCQIWAMETREMELLTQRYNGQLAVWDLRRRDAPIRVFEGHINGKPSKMPWFVDHEERYVFAIGSDQVVRGWSLAPISGEIPEVKNPLCEIAIPPPSAESIRRTEILSKQNHFQSPSVVYSDRWGGVLGNEAILISANTRFYLHELRTF